MQNDNQAAIKEMLKSFAYLLDEALKKTTKTYEGIVLSATSDSRKWNVKYNNEIHAVKIYGQGTPTVNMMVKVFVPQGNQALAWFFVPGSGGGGTGDGATFYPSVSEDGVISWTNDKDLPNPDPVNIKGPQGEQGVQGEAATIQVGTVTSGTAPSVTNSGTEQDAIFDFVLQQGPKGDTGDTGPQGEQGEKGDPGEAATIQIGTVTSGETPAVSNSGTPQNAVFNFVLQQGPQGEQGIQGPQGQTGPQGPQGEQGQQGETGPYFTPSVDSSGNLSWTNNGGLVNPSTVNIRGPQGNKGDTGEQGPPGTAATIQIGTVVSGTTPSVTNSGTEQNAIFNFVLEPGPQGIQGVQGEQGATGPEGPQGEQGETGPYFTPSVSANGELSWTNNGGLVNPPNVNIQGPKGDTGEQGEIGPQGPQGEVGPKGDTGVTGPQGEKGDPGEAATIQIGTVTSGDAPSVTNSGTLQNAIFDFVLQQGPQGSRGPQGSQGEVGPQGPQGIQGEQGPQGETGPYFTPAVDAEGNLSWTNNGDLTNPPTVNIKGPQGIQGSAGQNGTDATVNGVNTLTIEATGGLTGTQSGNTYSISGENLPYLKTTGGTLTGNLTGQYLTGTWLQSTEVYELSSSNFKGVCVFDGSGWVYYRTKEHFLADIGAATQDYVDSAVTNAGGVKKFNGTLGPNSWTTSGNYPYQAQINISDMTAESVPNAYPQWANQSVESIEWNKLSAIESFNGYVQFYATSPFSVSIDYVIEY